jgi:hypothetical protein
MKSRNDARLFSPEQNNFYQNSPVHGKLLIRRAAQPLLADILGIVHSARPDAVRNTGSPSAAGRQRPGRRA